MSDAVVRRQAQEIAAALPRLMRHLFALHPDDPSAALTLAQTRVCTLLTEGPLTMSAAGRELGISLSAMTQIADRLERSGLVQRTADEGDRRVRILELTPHGAKVMGQRDERRIRRVLEAIEGLPVDARERIIGALRSLEMASVAVPTDEGVSAPTVGEGADAAARDLA